MLEEELAANEWVSYNEFVDAIESKKYVPDKNFERVERLPIIDHIIVAMAWDIDREYLTALFDSIL